MAATEEDTTARQQQNFKVTSTSKVSASLDKLVRVGYYEMAKTIGHGNFATVKLASNIVTKTQVSFYCYYNTLQQLAFHTSKTVRSSVRQSPKL